MQEVVPPFALKFKGRDADKHTVNTQLLGESLVGAAKIYNAVAHYTLTGKVPRGNYRKKYVCYAQATKEGSFEFWVYVAAVAHQSGVMDVAHKEAVKFIFAKTIGAITGLWSKPKSIDETVKMLVEQFDKQAERDHHIQEVLAEGLIKANDNAKEVQLKLIDTLGEMAARTTPPAKQLVAPVGKSVDEISQFSGTQLVTKIDQLEAAIIRGEGDTIVDKQEQFHCRRITELNLDTTHCIVHIPGMHQPISGYITDPALKVTQNVYTQAFHERTPLVVTAKALAKKGEIKRLYISDAKPLLREAS